MSRKILLVAVIALLVTAPLVHDFGTVSASSHREAPLISQDPLADNTDRQTHGYPLTGRPLSIRHTLPGST